MDEYTFECFKNLVIDLANLLYQVELDGNLWFYCKATINELPKDSTDFIALGFMHYSFIQFIWPKLSEAEKPEVAEANAEDFGHWLEFGKTTGFWGSEEEMKKARDDFWADFNAGIARVKASHEEVKRMLEDQRARQGQSGQLVQPPHAQPTGTSNLSFEEVMRESQRKHKNFRNLMDFMHQLNMNHLKIMGKPW